jgi:hypothetical protein
MGVWKLLIKNGLGGAKIGVRNELRFWTWGVGVEPIGIKRVRLCAHGKPGGEEQAELLGQPPGRSWQAHSHRQVTPGTLNLAVRRNADRFPEDFAFQLTKEEHQSLLLQFARAKICRGGPQTPPYAFTEHGVAMLSSVLNSKRAVQMNIVIIRAFVRLRELLATHKVLADKIEKLEQTQKAHGTALVGLIQDVQRLKNPPQTRAFGFVVRGTPKKK